MYRKPAIKIMTNRMTLNQNPFALFPAGGCACVWVESDDIFFVSSSLVLSSPLLSSTANFSVWSSSASMSVAGLEQRSANHSVALIDAATQSLVQYGMNLKGKTFLLMMVTHGGRNERQEYLPRQKKSWVLFGTGNAPSAWYKAISARMVQKTERILSGRFPIVEIEHTSKAFATMNWIIDRTDYIRWLQQSIPETLMISFDVIQLSNTKHI